MILKSMGPAADGSNQGIGDLVDKLNIMIENVRKEMYAKFTEAATHEGLRRRVVDLESLTAK